MVLNSVLVKRTSTFRVPFMVLFVVAQASNSSIKEAITCTMHCVAHATQVRATQELHSRLGDFSAGP